MPVKNAKEIGNPIASPIVNLAAAGVANAAVVYTIPVLAGVLVGTRSAIIKKIHLNDRGTGGTKMHIGTGVGGGFAQLVNTLDTVNGLNSSYSVENGDFPDGIEAFANITAYPDAVGASSIDIQIEVLDRG